MVQIAVGLVRIQRTVSTKVIVDAGKVINRLDQSESQHTGKEWLYPAMQGNHFAARCQVDPSIDVARKPRRAGFTSTQQSFT